MARLVQFMHPGRQPTHQGPGVKPWNTTGADHRRSFLMAPGLFRRSFDGPVEAADQLLFWGAWEAFAGGEHCRGPARTVFVPIPPRFPERPGLHVTDPFVFDGPFLYSCCQQKEKPSLRNLQRGDVMLFGSKLDGDFVLDTVFVVAESEPYETHAGLENLGAKVPSSFAEVTLKPLAFRWLASSDELHPCATTLAPYRLYWGATPENPVNGMFSFVPAKPAGDPVVSFKRPVVHEFVNPNLSRGIRECFRSERNRQVFVDPVAVRDAWARVANSVIHDGFVLGTNFWIPQEENRRLWIEEALRRDAEFNADPSRGRTAADVFRDARARLG
jgi:hypothetical protein